MADGEDSDNILSDVEQEEEEEEEEEQQQQHNLRSSTDDVSTDKLRQLVTELDRERKAREAVEQTKSELQLSFNRLKVLAHEAIKKRDEVLRSNQQLTLQFDNIVKERDELVKEKDELVKSKEGFRSEIGTAAQMLVSGIDKISGKVNRFRNFSSGGLPRSDKYTGLPAVAYGVIKRVNEIVEELLRQIEVVTKSRNEAREQMEVRSYEIAIEVSELEATISGLRDDLARKGSVVERLEKLNEEKDEMMGELERELKEKQERMDSQRLLMVKQLGYVSKIHDKVCEVVKVVDGERKSDFSDSLFMPQEMDLEENIRVSLAGLETVNELSLMALEKTKDLVDERSREVEGLNETVTRLTREKEHIGSLLRSALSRRMSADPYLKTNELFKVTEKGLRESGVDYRFNNHTEIENAVLRYKDGDIELDDDEISTLAGALENIIKQSQIEIIELQHSVDELRAESSLQKELVEAQAKELLQSKQKVEALEEKERVANENVEGLMMDIAAAEEEITRWKVAAQQEAAAGKAVEQDYVAQLHTIRQDLEEANQSVIESEKKLKFKEETAAAAMSARDAAETSLKLADTRAARLRERVEELTNQLEELDTRKSLINGKRPRYICWPWQWLGLDPIGPRQLDTHQHTSNEMELSEPLL